MIPKSCILPFMRTFSLLAVATLTILLFACGNKKQGKPRILVFTKTMGYRHSSIPNGQQAIIKLGAENGFDVDTTMSGETFNEDSLGKYAAVVFLNTTDSKDSLLDHYQENAFTRYIEAGGGFVGVHAATDAGYHWGWYGRLVGGYFNGHPEEQEAVLDVVDSVSPATVHLPRQWKRTDEWYNFKNLNKDVHVLIRIDEHSYKGGTNDNDHPMSWYHNYDGGRAFYTELGHTEESYTEPLFLKHLLGGIQYAIGENNQLDYAKAHTLKTPPEEQFTKTVLKTGGFYEPTEFTILPNLDILIAQRRGEVLLYKHADTSLTQAALLKVYHQSAKKEVNAEEGLLGIKADPDFASNNFVYVFYSPFDTSVNRLSRFTFTNDKLDSTSEKIILQFYSQRNICCHTGGSIAFGKNRMLYVSAGDNSTPFDEPKQKYPSRSYAPLDDRPGHEQYDARRSAGNTNDLRGKILRIRMNEDGTYEIPEGNLFPKGTDKTRPEIYVMGDRNPYRISVDQVNGFLYWGEVGPDANRDSLGRGPRGYDEVNQARKAGYFGWPLFVGNNYPYSEYDYATGKMGTTFDPAKPVNNSRNNTGLKELPPAQPAFIYYPYAASPDFPQLGSGGRNAMAGPVFYSSIYKNGGIPAYYDGKLFIYDFIRGWIKAVTMLPNGDFDNMEPFMEHIKLHSAIDMEMGPDGKIYVLEYGTGWFTQNADAALSRIDYDSTAKAKPREIIANVPKPAVDSAQLKQGHQQLSDVTLGMNIMDKLDCKTCHKTDGKSIGPAFAEVAKKYRPTAKNIDYLVNKIQNGGSGVWGEVAMAAHPALPSEDGRKIVAWIMSLKK
jgi:cytochrome c